MTSKATKPGADASTTPTASEEKLAELLRSFRLMTVEHGRVIIHESEKLAMGATDIRALFYIHENADATTPKQVAEFLELSTGATTSLVDRMEGAGTLVREAHPTDRRSVVLRVTPQGREAVETVSDVYRCALARVIPESALDEMSKVFLDIATALSAGSGSERPVSV